MNDMPKNKHLKLLLTIFYILLAGVIGYFFFKYLFKWLLPFFIAIFVAWIMQPVKRLMVNKLHMPKRLTGIIITLVFYTIVGLLISLLTNWAIHRVREFYSYLPEYLSSIPAIINEWKAKIVALLSRLPADLVGDVLDYINNNLSDTITLPSIDMVSVVSTAKDVAFSIPTILIFIVSLLVATAYFINDFDMIIGFVMAQLPERFNEGAGRLISHLLSTLKSWAKAMIILMFITFVELFIGFLIIGIDYAGVVAALVSIVDALPVLGVGTVVVPWIFYLLLVGDYLMALYMTILYVIVTVIRNIIEPKIVGVRIGLYPLLELICFYFGYRTLGILGMFIIPLILITLDTLQKWGYIHIWNSVPQPEEVVRESKLKKLMGTKAKDLINKKRN